jgi:antitoxin component YwqK of YwqJK toxin-antitoxin module
MRKLLTLIFLSMVGVASAQKIPDYGFNKIRIALSDKIIQADLTPLKSDPKTESDKTYYWSSSNAIHTSQGGFSGKLLNGDYAEYYLNKNLKEQGSFKGGLKHGVWKSWNEGGILVESFSWVDGSRTGEFELFSTYTNEGKAETVDYKNGKVIEKKPSAFLEKINIFKRLKKDSTGKSGLRRQQAKPKQ